MNSSGWNPKWIDTFNNVLSQYCVFTYLSIQSSIQGKWFTIDCNLYSKPNLIINGKKKELSPFLVYQRMKVRTQEWGIEEICYILCGKFMW